VARVFILSGPTAAGKTDLALSLAEEFDASIVSADAMTVYRGLDIGTAKPSAATRERFPHACVDVRNIDEKFSVADFCQAFDDVCTRSDRVVVVGGTPFYLAALLQPLARLPAADPELRIELEKIEDLHKALEEVDPRAAARLHPNDRVRLIRALEVHALTGRSLSEIHEEGASREPLVAELSWLDRDELRDRVAARLQIMMNHGYLEEVRGLLDAGWDSELKPLKSFAYRYIIAHVQGRMDIAEALRCTERDTWRFARKQRSWARSLEWIATGIDQAREQGRRALG
jgi:tRNA dimethylallyltransferase